MATGLQADCRQFDAALDLQWGATHPSLPPEVSRHVAECARCRALYQSLMTDAPSSSVGVLPEVERHIADEIRKSLTPVSPLPSTRVLASQLAATFLVVCIALSATMKLAGIPAMSQRQMLGMSAIFALGIVLLSRSLAWQMTPGSRQRLPAWTAVAILAASVLIGMLVLFPMRTPQAFLARGLHCLRIGLLLAIPSAALFWWLARRGAPLNLTTLGATLGALAGLVSVALLQVTCDVQEMNHLLVWHGGVLLTTTLFGAGIGHFFAQHSSGPREK